MKKLTIVSLSFNVLILLFVLCAWLFGYDWVKDTFVNKVMQVAQNQRRSMMEATPVQPGAIIFLGNSITEGVHWHEFFPDKRVLNRGIGGDMTPWVLKRMPEIVRHQPTALFICIGTNDLAFGLTVDSIITNYRAIVRTVQQQSPATRILVQSVLPVGRIVLYGHNKQGVEQLNEAIQQMCTELQVPYLNVHALFADPEGYLGKQYTNDNLHLMGNAYLKWVDYLQPYMASLPGRDTIAQP